MRRRLSDQERAEAAELARIWEASKHNNAVVTVTVMEETDDSGRAVYEATINAHGTLPAISVQLPPSV